MALARGNQPGQQHGRPVRAPGERFRMHWLVTGTTLGVASWALIGALVAAVLGAWFVAGWLVFGAAVAVGLLFVAARTGRARRPTGRIAVVAPQLPGEQPTTAPEEARSTVRRVG